MKGLHILATGHYAPRKIVTNDDLSKIVDTSDEWIYTRTGMKERHFCTEEEGNLSMAVEATRQALDKAGIDKNEIGALVVATFSGDCFVPSVACLLQKELDLPDEMICFDLNAACSGFVFGLETIRGLMLQSDKKYAVLVGSEVISRKLDMTDRGTCILFGDGAGAVVLELDENRCYHSVMGCHGDADVISVRTDEDKIARVRMDGQTTYKFAVSTVPQVIKQVAEKANVALDDIDLFICHQANARILDAVSRTLKQPKEKFFMNISEYGNTSAASVAIALSDANNKGLLKEGQKIMLAGFGAGKTWGAVLIDW